jgi:hypothetical protein
MLSSQDAMMNVAILGDIGQWSAAEYEGNEAVGTSYRRVMMLGSG